MTGVSAWLERSILAIVALLCATIVCAFGAIVLHPPEQLAHLNPAGSFVMDGVHAGEAPRPWMRGQRYGSWNGSDAGVGVLTSDAFDVGTGVQGFSAGSPEHEGISVELVREDTKERLRVSGLPNTASRWTFFRFFVPPAWIGARVRAVATDASRSPGGWVALGDVVGIDGAFSALTRSAWWILALASSLLVTVLALVPLVPGAQRRWIGLPVLFAAAMFVMLLVYRLPSIDSGWLFNPDEAQMTAQAITAVHHPIPWRDYDGTTSGPLNTLAAAVPAVFGFTPSLPSSRFIQVILLAAGLGFLFAALRTLCEETVARVAVVLPLAFLCVAADYAFISYTSEAVSIALAAAAIALCARLALPDRSRPVALIALCGVAIGSLVFAKLQAAPYAAFLAAVTAGVLCVQSTARERVRRLAVFTAGLFAVPLLICAVTAAGGAFGDFWTTYIVFPRLYVAGNNGELAPPAFFFHAPRFGHFLTLSAVLVFAAVAVTSLFALLGRRTIERKHAIALILFVAMLALGVYMVQAPRTPFLHYLQWLIVPVTGIVAIALGIAGAQIRASRFGALRPIALAVCAVLAVAPAVGLLHERSTHETTVSLAPVAPVDDEARVLQSFIKPGQTVAMWGWMPQYLVYAGAVMGTRDAISQFQIEERPLKPYFRERYLRDFIANKPDFVVEAIGPYAFAFESRAAFGLQTFPALWGIISSTYAGVFETPKWRIYRRRDLPKSAAG